jgi:hypothetical protein
MDPGKANEYLDEYLAEIEELMELSYKEGNEKKADLDSRIQGFVNAAFENGKEKGYSSSRSFSAVVMGHVPSESEKQEKYISSLKLMKKHLIRFKEEIGIFSLDKSSEVNFNKMDVLEKLELIFSNFHKVVRQLRSRYNDKETLDVSDEYDVQDLLHAILHIFFLDIRPEEYTPSYAGSHRRMDFLLKPEKTVIEIKMTRKNLGNKEISEQLNDDIATYKKHGDCNILVCFIYDPEGRIRNPIGFESDLSDQSSDELQVKAFIYPK